MTTSEHGPVDAWTVFERRLVAALEQMPRETYLILEVPAGTGETGPYVQFALGETQFRAEAVSSRYLPTARRLTIDQERHLDELGWKRPTGDAGGNHYRDWAIPAPLAEVAHLAVRTLREVYGIDAPSELRYLHESFERGTVEQPDLGIESRPGAPRPPAVPVVGPSVAEVRQVLEEALARWLGIEHPKQDEDGDYPIRVGSALMFVRIVDGRPPVVAVFAPILRDVAGTADVLRELNEVNAHIRFGRAFWMQGQVLVASELTGADISPDQIAFACIELGSLADRLDDALHGRFGGKTMFEGRSTLVN